jgi:hypothetical protein
VFGFTDDLLILPTTVILSVNRTTVELVGTSCGEWQRLEKLVRLGPWTA